MIVAVNDKFPVHQGLSSFCITAHVLAESMDDLHDSATCVMTAPFHARDRKTVSACKPESVRFELSHALLHGTFFVPVWPLALSSSTLFVLFVNAPDRWCPSPPHPEIQ